MGQKKERSVRRFDPGRRAPAASFHFSPVSGLCEAGHPASVFARSTKSRLGRSAARGPAGVAPPFLLEGEADQNPKLSVVTTESASLLCVTEVPGTGPAGLTNGPVTSFSNAR